MALTSTEEAQTRALIAQNAALLSLAGQEPTIISKLAATKVSLADLSAASSLSNSDLFLVRQGTTEKSVAKSVLDTSLTPPDASTTQKGVIEIATNAEVQAGTDTVRAVTPSGLAATVTKQLQFIDYTLSGNALTLKLNPTSLQFRSATLTSGEPVIVYNSAQITTTISSGSTGGTISGVQSNIAILAINNAGTMELAWCNMAGGINLDETTLINTTAEGGAGAADSATTIYSTTARTGVAFRVVGIFRSIQTTAGTWAQTPNLVQPVGGQAFAAMQSIGYGQTWQDVTGSRNNGTTYYNTTGRPIEVYSRSSEQIAAVISSTLTINGIVASYMQIGANNNGISGATMARGIVPHGASYSIVHSGGVSGWSELR